MAKEQKKGNIGVQTENIFPVIKKFLYSDNEIFLRELVSNAVDATLKLRTLASMGKVAGELGDTTIEIHLDEKKKQLIISDKGIGMTAGEVERYINNIAFSGASEFLDKYKDGIFEVLDSSYEDIYGTVPFTEGMKKMLIDNFRLIIDRKFCAVILDENDKMVCFGLCFPSLAEAMQKSDGHLTPSALCRVLKAVKKPKVIDFALIGVDPKHLNHGVSVIIAAGLMHMLKDYSIEHCETNLNLEDNAAIHNLWKRFKEEKHKRRRSYIKSLIKTEQTDD